MRRAVVESWREVIVGGPAFAVHLRNASARQEATAGKQDVEAAVVLRQAICDGSGVGPGDAACNVGRGRDRHRCCNCINDWMCPPKHISRGCFHHDWASSESVALGGSVQYASIMRSRMLGVSKSWLASLCIVIMPEALSRAARGSDVFSETRSRLSLIVARSDDLAFGCVRIVFNTIGEIGISSHQMSFGLYNRAMPGLPLRRTATFCML